MTKNEGNCTEIRYNEMDNTKTKDRLHTLKVKALIYFVVCTLMLTLLPIPAHAASNAKGEFSGTVPPDVAAAYSEVMRAYCIRFGTMPMFYAQGFSERYPWDAIPYMGLVDFDNNGIPELFVVYYTNLDDENALESTCELWNFSNGKANLIAKQDLKVGVTAVCEVQAGIVKVEGNTYLFNRYDWLKTDFYTLSNGKWIKAKSVELVFSGPDTPVGPYYIDGKKASKQAYDSLLSQMIAENQNGEIMNGFMFPGVRDGENSKLAQSYYTKLREQLSPRLARPSKATLTINGAKQSLPAYEIAGRNYFRIRDIAKLLMGTEKESGIYFNSLGIYNEDIYSDSPQKQGYVPTGDEFSAINTYEQLVNRKSMHMVGRNIFDADAFNMNGNNFFAIRDLGLFFDCYVGWDSASKTIILDPSRPYTE